MVTGAKHHARGIGQQSKIFLDDHDLRAEVDYRRDVERIACEDHRVKQRRRAEQPVELG
jgi:hypothetical protein